MEKTLSPFDSFPKEQEFFAVVSTRISGRAFQDKEGGPRPALFSSSAQKLRSISL